MKYYLLEPSNFLTGINSDFPEYNHLEEKDVVIYKKYETAMIDYLTYIYHAPVYEPLDKYRQYKLSEPVFPFSMLLIDSIKRNDEQKQQALKECSEDECGRFFLKYNIVEKDIRDVV